MAQIYSGFYIRSHSQSSPKRPCTTSWHSVCFGHMIQHGQCSLPGVWHFVQLPQGLPCDDAFFVIFCTALTAFVDRPIEDMLSAMAMCVRHTDSTQIELLNSKSTDLDWYYSKHLWKLKLLIRDLLFTTFMKNPPDLDWYYSKHFWKLKLLIRDLLFTTFMKYPPGE